MSKPNENSRQILSAGEIGSYTVCPESWRLKSVERVRAQESRGAVDRGRKLHQDWAEELDESAYLARSARRIVALLMSAIIIFLLLR